MQKGQERRQHRRYDKRLALRGNSTEPGAPENEAIETINLSLGGALCRIERHIPPMTRIQLRGSLPVDGEMREISAEAVVVRIEPERAAAGVRDYRVALFFSQIAEEDRRTLEAWLVS